MTIRKLKASKHFNYDLAEKSSSELQTILRQQKI